MHRIFGRLARACSKQYKHHHKQYKRHHAACACVVHLRVYRVSPYAALETQFVLQKPGVLRVAGACVNRRSLSIGVYL